MIGQLIIIIILAAAIYLFSKNVAKIRRNILLGKDTDRSDQPAKRWRIMAKVALGQTKMVKRPVAAGNALFYLRGFCDHQPGSAGDYDRWHFWLAPHIFKAFGRLVRLIDRRF